MTPYLPAASTKIVGVVGTGAVGASWIALFLARGFEVVAHDPGPEAEARARTFVASAWPALRTLEIAPDERVPIAALRFVRSANEVAEAADVIQENVPERPDIKEAVLREIDAAAAPHKIIASSTGGIPPSMLQRACSRPERFVVIHPFNPTHLIPLVEVVGGVRTSPQAVAWAMDFCRAIGKHPIHIRNEATGHMANRLQFALLREAVHCLNEGLASAQDIDDAVRYALAPRWTLMGGFLTLHLAGGLGGMKGILAHAGDAIEGWWSDLGAPRLTPDTRARLEAAAAEVSKQRSIADWERWRDEQLVAMLQLLHAADSGEARQ